MDKGSLMEDGSFYRLRWDAASTGSATGAHVQGQSRGDGASTSSATGDGIQGRSRGNGASIGSAAGDRSLSEMKDGAASTGSATGDRSLSETKEGATSTSSATGAHVQGQSRGDMASTGSATGAHVQGRSRGDGASTSSATGDRPLSQSRGIFYRQILIWSATGLFILLIIVIIMIANWGVLPAPIGMMYHYAWGDKLGHFLLMGLLAFLVNLSFSAKRIQLFSRPVYLGSVLVLVAVCLEEFSQLFVSSRSFSLLDLSFDFLGILCASWLISRLCSRKLHTA